MMSDFEQGSVPNDFNEAERLACLENIALAISGATTVNAVAEVIITEGMAALGGHSGSITLLNEDASEFTTIRSKGYPDEFVASHRHYPSSSHLPSADAARTREAIFITTIEELNERYPNLLAVIPGDWGALAALPLIVDARALGSLVLNFPRDREFNTQDRAFLQTIGQICAQALERARLFDAAQQEIVDRKAAEGAQRFLTGLADATRSGMETEELLYHSVSSLGKYLQATRCTFEQIDPATGMIIVHRDYHDGVPSMSGLHPSTLFGARIRDELSEGFTVTVTDTSSDPRTADFYEDGIEPFCVRAFIKVPILKDDCPIGVLAVQNWPLARAWKRSDIELVEEVADRMFLALENVRLQRAEAEQNRRNRAILESITDGFVSLDRDWRFTYANQEAARLLNHPTDDLIGRIIWEIFPDDAEGAFHKTAKHAFEVQKPISWQTHSAQRGVWFETRIYPSPEGLSVHFRDITEAKAAEQERRDFAVRRRTFVHDVLASVSDGRLNLCFSNDDLPKRLNPASGEISVSLQRGIGDLRRQARDAAVALGFPDERWQDLVAAVSECATNAAVHANGGAGQVCSDGSGQIQVWVADQGQGIAVEALPAATLKKGYTTAGTMGHGFKLILKTVDRTYLLTGPKGTTVVLEQNLIAPLPDWAQIV